MKIRESEPKASDRRERARGIEEIKELIDRSRASGEGEDMNPLNERGEGDL